LSTPGTPSPVGAAPKQKAATANDFIEQQLDDRLEALEVSFGADAIGFSGPIVISVDDIVRTAIEKKKSTNSGNNRLAFFLTTTGGYIEVVQRIVDTLRMHYQLIDFIIPNYAYSAGTVLALSGDAIYMDYYSRLGPIDPQVETKSGQMVSAMGYLERYEKLITKAANNKISAAEVQLLIQGFDQGDLYHYEQARELSIALLKDWLVRYKFKNWKRTQTRKVQVTRKMKVDRAASIARELNKTSKWHVHGHGISKDVLKNDLKLIIDDFSMPPTRGIEVREYHNLLADYMARTAASGAIHFAGQYQRFM
jgi:hypothetical protein